MSAKPEAERGRSVALLRGINVGGKNKLPMRDLVRLFTRAGCSNVETYIQSGNVVFATSLSLSEVATQVETAITKEFGLRVPLVMRRGRDLLAVLRANPFLEESENEGSLHVGFLADRPTKEALADLDPTRGKDDRFVVRGREIFLFLADGVAKTKLTNAYFDRVLRTTTTVRNWRTVMKLAELAGA